MNVLDLFSGIGGFSLGLERAGMRTVAFCEIEPYCRSVLRKHWPDVPVFGDVRTLTAEALADAVCAGRQQVAGGSHGDEASHEGRPAQHDCQLAGDGEGSGIELICGGFPCQDISVAGKGAGIEGARSGLWSEYARIIGEVRPRYVIVENVAALLGRGIERVLGDLAALGFDSEWHCIPASAVGAPHRRDRVWIVAYPRCGVGDPSWNDNDQRRPDALAASGERSTAGQVAHAASPGLEGRQQSEATWPTFGESSGFSGASHANGKPTQRLAISWGECGRWLAEPDVGRVAHGVPFRVDRLRSLGNAIVPQIAEIIGRAIMQSVRGD